MPIRYILDTDNVTYHQLGRPTVVQKLATFSPQEVATTVVTMYEQLRGRLAAINRKQDHLTLSIAFRRLQATQSYYCHLQVLPLDERATDIYRQLMAQKLRIGAQDLQIAAITLSNDAVLVTSNRRHFDLVSGLQIEDWNRA